MPAIAYAATAVLPDPTSPCNSRSIGTSPPRSCRTSAIAATWSSVSATSRPARPAIPASSVVRTSASVASSIGSGGALVRVRSRRRVTIPNWSANSSSKASRRSAASRPSNVSG
jgi:hypothetical protein